MVCYEFEPNWLQIFFLQRPDHQIPQEQWYHQLSIVFDMPRSIYLDHLPFQGIIYNYYEPKDSRFSTGSKIHACILGWRFSLSIKFKINFRFTASAECFKALTTDTYASSKATYFPTNAIFTSLAFLSDFIASWRHFFKTTFDWTYFGSCNLYLG